MTLTPEWWGIYLNAMEHYEGCLQYCSASRPRYVKYFIIYSFSFTDEIIRLTEANFTTRARAIYGHATCGAVVIIIIKMIIIISMIFL